MKHGYFYCEVVPIWDTCAHHAYSMHFLGLISYRFMSLLALLCPCIILGDNKNTMIITFVLDPRTIGSLWQQSLKINFICITPSLSQISDGKNNNIPICYVNNMLDINKLTSHRWHTVFTQKTPMAKTTMAKTMVSQKANSTIPNK